MAKWPSAGQTKTRLCPPLTPAQARRLYGAFLQDTLALVRSVAGVRPCLAYTPAEKQRAFQHLAPGFHLIEQQGPDLGTRLEQALRAGLALGISAGECSTAIATGSDSPTLPLALLRQAVEVLQEETVDVVLGPSEDGGYYLIGLRKPAPRLVLEPQMSTPHLLQDTLSLADELGLRVHCLPTWYDVDDAGSLERLQADLVSLPAETAAHTRRILRRMGNFQRKAAEKKF